MTTQIPAARPATFRTSSVRPRRRQSWGRLLGLVGLFLFGLIITFPFYFLLTTSIKSLAEAWLVPITWVPRSFSLYHYSLAFQQGFGRALLNGFIYAGLGTLLVVYISAMIGFVIVKLPSRFGNFFFWLMNGASLIPLATYVVTMVGVEAKITKLTGIPMLDTYQGLLMPRLIHTFAIFMMRQAMLSMPNELLESAKMDGAGLLRQFNQITLPVVSPQVVTLLILIFMGLYSEFLWPLVATSSADMQVLSVWLATRMSGYGINPGQMAAFSTLVILPMMVAYVAGQRYIVQGIGLTGFR